MPRPVSTRSLVLSLLLCAPVAQAAPGLPPVASFFGTAEFSNARLSPSGRYLAANTINAERRIGISVFDLNNPESKPVVIDYVGADIRYYTWINDDYLAYNLTDRQIEPERLQYASGLFSVRRDGTGDRQLAVRRGGPPTIDMSGKIQVWVALIMPQPGTPGKTSLYVAEPIWDPVKITESRLLRVDPIHSLKQYVAGPQGVNWWTLDAAGEPRIAKVNAGRSDELWYREQDGNWRKLREDLPLGAASDPVVLQGFGPDGALYATARNGKENAALYALDIKSGQVTGAPLLAAKGYDVDPQLVTDGKKLLGVRYRTDAVDTVWFDEQMAEVQKRVDALLPSTINLLTPPRYGDEPWVLVESQSDVIPTGYLLFNRKTGELTLLGSSHPQIQAQQMGSMRTVHYKARDGLDIEALLTLPPGAKNKPLPLVVLAHDGPWERGSTWGWRDESQFLASRGYAVLEPAYRGSTGLGNKLFEAGRRQWGEAMQNDLADGARWALDQGLAAEGRVCIAGKGYGGYATLMGLARDPGLYQCGVAWGAITDLQVYASKGWDSGDNRPGHYKDDTVVPLLGDPVRDAVRLKQASPITQADRIHAPLLLAHGDADRIVPVEHARRFYKAVKRSNENVELVEYPSEWNTWETEKTRFDFWQRVETFLDQQIGEHLKGRVTIRYDQTSY